MGALTELVSKARRGLADSKLELEEQLRPLVHGVLLAWVPHAAAGGQVRRLIEEGFGAIMSDDARFVPTLLSRARNAGQNAYRLNPDAADAAAPDPAVREALAVLARLRKLPERERERLALRLIEGIGGPQLAEALGANEREVQSDLERALAALQEGIAAPKDDPYLWALTGTPHPVAVRLENLLTPLRYDDAAAAAQERDAATLPVGVRAAPRRNTAAETVPAPAPSMAPTSVNVDPRRNSLNIPAQPESTDPPGKVQLLPFDADDEEFDERTEALVAAPRQKNPFEAQPGTIAAQNLPAAAQVNPYAGMPGTIAANDLPAAARVDPEGPVPQSPGKRPTGGPGPAPTRVKVEDFDESTGMQVPGPLKRAAEPLGGPISELPTGAQVSLGQGESSTRMVPVGAPVHWKSVLFAEDDDEASITLPVPERNRLLRKKGVWRGRAPFVIAGMMGTLAVAVAWMTLASSSRRSTRAWNLVPVSVAAVDLSEGMVVTDDKVSTRAVPEQFVTASVVKPDSYSYVVGQRLVAPVQAGDPLLWSHFEMAQVTERLARRVQKRARAVSFTIGRAQAVGNWVRPGDWVDLVFSVRDPSQQGGLRAAVTLIQDVPVIATGKISEKTNYGILNAGQRNYHTVSVLLLPEEVEMVTLAKEVGNVQLTLRNEDDHDVNRDGYLSSAKTLLEGERVKALAIRRTQTIQFIRETPAAPVPMPRPDRLRIEPRQ